MKTYGLIGEKLSHSLSPKIHEVIYQEAGIKANYCMFELSPESLKNDFQQTINDGIDGLNITIPYKKEIIDFLTELDPLADRLGAVNTIRFCAGGKTKGYNTDYYGIQATFDRMKWNLQGKKVYIMGSGGAAQAMTTYVLDQKASKVGLVSRSPAQQPPVPGAEWLDYERLENRQGDFLINATPVGMYPKVDTCPISEKGIKNFSCLFDMIYNPKETVFLKLGRLAGLQTVNGLDMLIYQAIKAVELWEGQPISVEVANRIIERLKEEV